MRTRFWILIVGIALGLAARWGSQGMQLLMQQTATTSDSETGSP